MGLKWSCGVHRNLWSQFLKALLLTHFQCSSPLPSYQLFTRALHHYTHTLLGPLILILVRNIISIQQNRTGISSELNRLETKLPYWTSYFLPSICYPLNSFKFSQPSTSRNCWISTPPALPPFQKVWGGKGRAIREYRWESRWVKKGGTINNKGVMGLINLLWQETLWNK